MVTPITKTLFGAELLIESEWSVANYQPIYFPEEYKGNIRLKKVAKIDDTYYIIPQPYGSNDIGEVCGTGATMAEAIANCIDIAETVEGNDIHIRIDTLDDAEGIFTKFEDLNG
jgi:hypothetical protein